MAVNDNTFQQLLLSCIVIGIIPIGVLMVGFPIYWTCFIQPCSNKSDTTTNVLNEKYLKQGKKVCKTKVSEITEPSYRNESYDSVSR